MDGSSSVYLKRIEVTHDVYSYNDVDEILLTNIPKHYDGSPLPGYPEKKKSPVTTKKPR